MMTEKQWKHLCDELKAIKSEAKCKGHAIIIILLLIVIAQHC